MDSRKLAWSTVLAALALWGCDGGGLPPGETFPARDKVCAAGESAPCETTEPALDDAARTAEPGEELDNETFTYVLNVLSIPAAEDGAAAGFNLDGIDSGPGGAGETCEESIPDFASSTDADRVGVDNALADLVELLSGLVDDGLDADDPCKGDDAVLDCLVAGQINEGSLLLLVQVSGVESLEYDTEVQMQLQLGALPEGATAMLEGGVLAPGQMFNVEMDLGPAVTGDIFQGNLRATTELITISITTGGDTIPLRISNPEVRFDIAEDGLTNGEIGGVLTLADLQMAADVLAPGMDITALAGGFADVIPSSDDPLQCEALSVGIRFTGTTAVTP